MENLGPFDLPLSFYGTAGIAAVAALLWVIGRRAYGAAAGWTALALLGQACALQLMLAGPSIRLQMFRGWSDLLSMPRLLFVVVVAAQALIVAAGLRPHATVIRRHAAGILTWPRAVLMFGLLLFSATTIPPEAGRALANRDLGMLAGVVGGHASKFALSMFLTLTGLVNLGLAAAAIPAPAWERLERWWRGSNRSWVPWVAAGWVLVVSSTLAWLVLERIPHIGDELAYLWQAKHLAEGRLSLPTPPDGDAFWIPFTFHDSTRWINAMLIGWPVILAVGVRLGVPWLVNPLLGAAGVLLAHALVRRLYNRDLADAVALLLAASPWLLWMSANLMPHAASLVLFLLVMLGVSHARDTGAVAWAAVAGLSCGALLHVRPLEAVVAGLVAGVWWLSAGVRAIRWPALIGTVVCGCAMTALFLAYNRYVTGDWLRVPLNVYFDAEYTPGTNRLGFGADIGNWGWTGLDALRGHGPIEVFLNTNQNLHLVQVELFGWACGSITLVYLLAAWRRRRQDAMMWLWIGSVVTALNLYWFSGGADFGARYWYFSIVPFTVLALRGAMEVRNSLLTHGAAMGASRVAAFILLASIVGTTNFLVWRSLDKYVHYRGARADLRAVVAAHTLDGGLVLIRGRQWPDYGSAAPFNPPHLDAAGQAPVFAHEGAPASVARLRAFYADRPVWIIAGPSDRRSFHIVAGPIAPGQPIPIESSAEPSPQARATTP